MKVEGAAWTGVRSGERSDVERSLCEAKHLSFFGMEEGRRKKEKDEKWLKMGIIYLVPVMNNIVVMALEDILSLLTPL